MIGRSGLEEEDPHGRVLAQAVREDAAGGAGATIT